MVSRFGSLNNVRSLLLTGLVTTIVDGVINAGRHVILRFCFDVDSYRRGAYVWLIAMGTVSAISPNE